MIGQVDGATEVSPGSRRLVGLPDVAALARVQRPVVTVWRRRTADSNDPFPGPVERRGTQELFDLTEIVDWLLRTGRGNNPEVAQEAALFAALDGWSEEETQASVAAATSMLALRAVTGRPLSALPPAELQDLADDVDPSDSFLFREVEGSGEAAAGWAVRADAMADGAYTVAAAFEAVMRHRHRLALRQHSQVALRGPALELVATLVAQLLDDESSFLVDPCGSDDLVVSIAELLTDQLGGVVVLSAPTTSEASRLGRRRLVAHGLVVQDLADPLPTGRFPEASLTLAQLPSPATPAADDREVLDSLRAVLRALNDDGVAVLIGPASALADQATTGIASARADLLRSARVQAIVRLPAGLWTSRSRAALALWVVGRQPDRAAPAPRVLVADLGGVVLDDALVADLVTDVVAAGAGREVLHRHSFRLGRLVALPELLARAGTLTGVAARPAGSRQPPAERLAVTDRLIAVVAEPVDGAGLDLALTPESARPVRTVTIEQLLRRGALRLLSGHRLERADLAVRRGVPVFGVSEVLSLAQPGERGVDRLRLAARYPAARYTEPGDVVFCTGSTPGARVDYDGFSVVAAPARLLRIDRQVEPGLLPDLLAADLGAIRPGSWRNWTIRLLEQDQAEQLEGVLAEVRAARQTLAARLELLNQLAGSLVDSVAGGAFGLDLPAQARDPRPRTTNDEEKG